MNQASNSSRRQFIGGAVDGHLTCIPGREAAARKTRLTLEQLLKENKKLEVDMKGLKA